MIRIEFGLLAVSLPSMTANGTMQHAIYGKWI